MWSEPGTIPSRRRSSSERMSTISASPAGSRRPCGLGLEPLDPRGALPPAVRRRHESPGPSPRHHPAFLARCPAGATRGLFYNHCASTRWRTHRGDDHSRHRHSSTRSTSSRSTRSSTTRSGRSATPCAGSSGSACFPEVGDWFEQGILPREIVQELAGLGLFGMHLEGYGLPGASSVAYGLDLPRARGRRLGRPERRLRAGLARDVRDLALGLGGAEGAVAPGDAPRARRSAASG